MENQITIYAHHRFSCGCDTMDVDLEGMTAAELFAILTATRKMNDPNLVVSAGPKELEALKYADLEESGRKITLDELKRQLGVKPEEELVAAIDAPKMFSSQVKKKHLFADARLFFIMNKETGALRSTTFNPYTDASSSNIELGEDAAAAKMAAVKGAPMKMRAIYMGDKEVARLRALGADVKMSVTEDDSGLEGFVHITGTGDEEAIAAYDVIYDAENQIE